MIKFIKRNYEYIIFSFFYISILSWFLEILYSLVFRSKLVSPGVLSGPWCPIYGVAFLCMLLFIKKKDNKIYNFFSMFSISTIIEYFASFISEKLFGRIIWEYSDKFLNINGRVCIEMSLLFGILGYITIYNLEPSLRRLYIRLNEKIKIINIILCSCFIVDLILNLFFI